MSNFMLTVILVTLLCSHAIRCQEPSCTKFSFLEQLLEKVVRMEIKMEEYRSQLDIIKQDTGKHGNYTIAPTFPSARAPVAFHAYMHDRRTYTKGDSIIFDTLITNIGQAYDSLTGVFLAPENGTYFFQATLLTDNNVEIWAYLTINGKVSSKLNARGTDGRHGSGTQAMIVSLRQNDEVKVINDDPNGKIYGDKYSTFVGYMLA